MSEIPYTAACDCSWLEKLAEDCKKSESKESEKGKRMDKLETSVEETLVEHADKLSEDCSRQADLVTAQQASEQPSSARCVRTCQARELLEKWKPAAEKLKELLEDSSKMNETGSWGKGFKIDNACIPLCNVMNLLPGTKTNSSCQGHGEQFFFVQFYCSEMSTLHLLVEVFREGITTDLEDGRHIDFSDWDIGLTNKLLIDLRLLERAEFCLFSESLGHEKDDEVTEQAAAFYAKEVAELAVDYAERLESKVREEKKEKEDV